MTRILLKTTLQGIPWWSSAECMSLISGWGTKILHAVWYAPPPKKRKEITHCIKSKENHNMMLKLSDKEFKLTITITTKFQRAITNSLETDEKIENLSKEIKVMEKN